MRRLALLAFLLAGILAFPACTLAGGYSAEGLPLADVVIRTQEGRDHRFRVEVARSAPELAKGLMFRTGMPSDEGMLFLFGEEGERSFWMKNTYIPLDVMFIRADGTIHIIHHSARQLSLEPLLSNGPVAAALELNGGTAARLGIRVGDRLYNRDYFGNEVAP